MDKAILKVYNELETGLTFEADEDGSAGHHLDKYLLKIAQELQEATLTKQAQELEAFMSIFKANAVEQYVKAQQGSVWKRVKAVFKPV